MLHAAPVRLLHVQINVFLTLFLVCDFIVSWIIIYYLFSNFKYVVGNISNKGKAQCEILESLKLLQSVSELKSRPVF